MAEQIQWLADIRNGHWARLAAAFNSGLMVPGAFVTTARSHEQSIRAACDEIKVREHTHFVAIRSAAKAVIDVIGNDRIVHTLRTFWAESPNDEILVQTMVNAAWCGKAAREGKNLRISASEGLLCLDADMYLFNPTTRRCSRRVLCQRPRKVFRAVDGTTRTMELNERRPLGSEQMEKIADLVRRVESDVTWVMDHRGVWLITR